MNLAFLNMGTQEVVFIVIIALFLFGGKKLPELARGLGRGIREFKDASEGIKKEISDQINNFEKDLDVEDHPKTTKVAEQAKAVTVAQEINTHQEDQTKEVQEGTEETIPASPKFPTFGPPAGTYEHNPRGAEPATEEEAQYYQYGYSDHFGNQSDVEQTTAQDSNTSNNTSEPKSEEPSPSKKA